MITKHLVSRTLIVHPLGDLDALHAEYYRRQLRSLIQEGYRFIIFDLQDTVYINSSSLGLIVEMYKAVTNLEGSLKLINCNNNVLDLMRLSHLDQLFLQSADPEATPEPAADLHFDSLHGLMTEEILALSQVQRVTEQLLRVPDVDEIGKTLLTGTLQALKSEEGVIYLYDEASAQLHLADWHGPRERPFPQELHHVPLDMYGEDVTLMQLDDPVWHERIDLDDAGLRFERRNFLDRLPFATALLVPIHGAARRLGLLIVAVDQESSPIMKMARPMVRTLASVGGMALERAGLEQALERCRDTQAQVEGNFEVAQRALADGARLAALGAVVSGLSCLIDHHLTPLLGQSEQLLQHPADRPAQERAALARIHDTAASLAGVAEKMERISHPGARKPGTVNLTQCLRSVAPLVADLAVSHQVTLVLPTTPPEVFVQGDAAALHQALLVVLHRSCTSFPGALAPGETRWIRVTATTQGQRVQLRVEDNGEPFDEYDLARSVDPLVPVEAMGQGRLFNYRIPDEIVQQQGGTLRLSERDGDDGGKQVTFDLPLALTVPR